MGIYSIKKAAVSKVKRNEKSAGVGLRSSYLRVVGIQVDTEGTGRVLQLRQNTTIFRCQLQDCDVDILT